MNQYAITYINEAGTFTRTDIVRAETIHSVHTNPEPGEVVYSIFLIKPEAPSVQG
jgi:hypothetical protein